MKKLISLVLALAMVLMAVGAFASSVPAASNPLNHDGSLTVSGLEEGDTVSYYKVLAWNPNDPKGWVFTSDFATVDDSVRTAILEEGISGEIASTLAPLASTAATPAGTITNKTWTVGSSSAPVDPGLYMVIITPGTPGLLYNPVFVASNFNRGTDDASENNSINLETNALSYSDEAMAKKSKIDVNKTATGHGTTGLDDADPYRTDVGEVLDFTVTTTIPKYPSNYTSPVFKVQDTLTGLTLDQSSIVVKAGSTTLTADTDYTVTSSATNYLVTFTSTYLENVPAAGQPITITYSAEVSDSAQLTVNQDTNTVDVIFSTNPSDTTGAGRLRDKTNHFTFSIDANILGDSDHKSHEVVKVGKDSAGNIIEAEQNYTYGTKHAALQGAVFGLYKDSACENLYTNDVFNGYVTSDGNGLLNIKGLDVGTYYLKEIEAPAGYIKVQDAVKVTIEATITENVEVTETIDSDGVNVTVTYKTNRLDSYSITFGEGTSAVTTSYTVNNNAQAVAETVTRLPASADKELENIKGVELPSTGGIGTTIFYVLGGLLVVGAAVILVARRKADN